jgi:hypothetical protein
MTESERITELEARLTAAHNQIAELSQAVADLSKIATEAARRTLAVEATPRERAPLKGDGIPRGPWDRQDARKAPALPPRDPEAEFAGAKPGA